MPLKLEDFLTIQDLPPDWQSVVHTEMLTGCSECGRRLISTNNTGTYVAEGVHVMRIHDDNDELLAAFALCTQCVERT